MNFLKVVIMLIIKKLLKKMKKKEERKGHQIKFIEIFFFYALNWA